MHFGWFGPKKYDDRCKLAGQAANVLAPGNQKKFLTPETSTFKTRHQKLSRSCLPILAYSAKLRVRLTSKKSVLQESQQNSGRLTNIAHPQLDSVYLSGYSFDDGSQDSNLHSGGSLAGEPHAGRDQHWCVRKMSTKLCWSNYSMHGYSMCMYKYPTGADETPLNFGVCDTLKIDSQSQLSG